MSPFGCPNYHKENGILCKLVQGDIEWIKQCFTQNSNMIHQNNACCLSYLSIACRLGDIAIVKVLIENGAQENVNAGDDKGLTPLHYAVLGNHLEVMRLMLDYGANVNTQNNEGHSPLHLAIIKNYINLVKPLLEAAGDSVKLALGTSYGVSTYAFSTEEEKEEENEEYCINEQYGNVTNLLDLACHSNNFDIVKLLLKFCVVEVGYDTALHLACCIGHINSVKLILQSGQDSNVVSKNGFTALHIACDRGFADIIPLLIQSKSDINKVSTSGDTALHIACSKKIVEVVKLLVKFNADANIVNRHGYTALHIACDNESTEIIKLLIDSKSDVNMVNTTGYTALHTTCNKGFIDIAKLLIQSGADINMKDKYNETSLHCAVLQQHYDVVKLILSQAEVKFDICNTHNQTPFLQAISKGNLGITQMLLLKGADVDAINKDGDNCLHVALREKMFHSESEHLEILDEISYQLKENRLSSIVVAVYLAKQGANFYHKNKNNTTPLDIINNSDLKNRLELYLAKLYECFICGDNLVSIKFHPCRHRIVCEECCSKIEIKKCNRCKQTVISKTRFDGSEFKTVNSPQEFNNKQLSDEMCLICMERRRDMVFDCGHTTCKKCGEVLDDCHMCRKHIMKKIIIH
ncbi:E3 ubiquitin-protein ligase MIB2 isoform X1 [Octopus bimaculoides]|uniref:RING-type domain-containing protein n=2 Tax=Octopus bimaculoides TaxID=37653 RepID=A0A0L8G691_OCTBM|nr:E3 ubiquitin-protein ligase MIB2 isoform X1 [Octopus bimaculoides]